MTNPTPPGQVPEALRFTKRPVTIEAIQWTGKNLREVIAFTDGPPDTRSHHAGMAWEAYADLVARDGLMIYTLEDGPDRRAKHFADIGDWIIRGVKGEYYPCKPDIFEATYDRAAHVQNPAEIEHVAGDVSKNGAESNMSTQQTAPAGFVPVAAFDRLHAHAESLAARLMAAPPQKEVQEPYGWLYDWTHSSATGKPDTTYTGFTKDEAHARKHDNCTAVFTTQQPAPATQQAGATKEHVRLVRVIADKIEDGTLFRSGIYSNKDLARFVRNVADAAAPQPSPTAQTDSQPAPEYVGNGMFKGETIEKAAEHWANWCDVRCMTGLSEFLRVVAARAPADSVTAPAGEGVAGPGGKCMGPRCMASTENGYAHSRECIDAAGEVQGWKPTAEDYAKCGPSAPTQPAQAESVLEDAARLDWLDQQCEAYGFQDIHEGTRWEISGPYANVRVAIDAERAARKQGGV